MATVEAQFKPNLQPSKVWLWLSIGLHSLVGLATVAIAIGLTSIIAGVFRDGLGLADLWPWFGAMSLVVLLRFGLQWLAESAAQRFAQNVKQQLRQRLVGRMLALGSAQGQQSASERVQILGETVELLDDYLAGYLPQRMLAAIVPLLMIAWVWPYDRLSAIVLALTVPVSVVMLVLVGLHTRDLSQQRWVQLRRLNARVLDLLQGLTTLKVFGRSRAQIQQIDQLSRKFTDATLAVLQIAFVSALVLELTASLSTAVVAVEIGLRLLNGSLQFYDALLVLVLAPEVYAPIRALGAQHHAGMQGLEAAEQINRFLAQPRADVALVGKIQPVLGDLIVQNLAICYAEDGPNVLQQGDWHFPQGQHTLIQAPSGAGKTSLVLAILRLIQPTAGEIKLGATPIDQLDLTQWRSMIAYIPQHPYLFNGTIAQNIALTKPDASLAAIQQAAGWACANGFIEQLPAGYATLVAEGGANLSGGQRQRIAIARAMLKDCPIILADEPFAHLDRTTAQQIRRNLAELWNGRTIIEFSHEVDQEMHEDQLNANEECF